MASIAMANSSLLTFLLTGNGGGLSQVFGSKVPIFLVANAHLSEATKCFVKISAHCSLVSQ